MLLKLSLVFLTNDLYLFKVLIDVNWCYICLKEENCKDFLNLTEI